MQTVLGNPDENNNEGVGSGLDSEDENITVATNHQINNLNSLVQFCLDYSLFYSFQQNAQLKHGVFIPALPLSYKSERSQQCKLQKLHWAK